MAADPAIRRSLALGVRFDDPGSFAGTLEAARTALISALQQADVEQIADTLQAPARGTQRAAPVGPLRQLRDADAITAETLLRLREHLAATLDDRDREPHAQPGRRVPLGEEDVAPVKALLAEGEALPVTSGWTWPGSWCWPAWPWWVERAATRLPVRDGRPRAGGPRWPAPPPRRGWLLLEHPGPWPIDAVAGSGIEPAILLSLRTAAAIGGPHPAGAPAGAVIGWPRRWMLAGPARPRSRAVAGGQRSAAAAGPGRGAGRAGRDAGRVILVCTHGVHDACCAIRGRPVAAALTEQWPGQVWECSHVGGDRFAPNVVVLPDGFYYGNLDPDSAVRTVRQHLAGAVEAAVARRGQRSAARTGRGRRGVRAARPPGSGAVTVEHVHQVGPHDGHGSETTVNLRWPDHGLVLVEVVAVRRPPAQLTCRAARETPATEYQVGPSSAPDADSGS